MLHSLRILAGAVAATLVAACAAPQMGLQDRSKIHNVAVLNLVPETASFSKAGVTKLNDDRADIDLGGRIDQTVKSLAQARLTDPKVGWTLHEVEYDRTALRDLMRPNHYYLGVDAEKVNAALANVARANNLDALVVVSPDPLDNSRYEGYGILLDTGFLRIHGVYVYSKMRVEVFGADGRRLSAGFGTNEPQRELDADAWGISAKVQENMRPELVAKLSDQILDYFSKKLSKEFDEAGL